MGSGSRAISVVFRLMQLVPAAVVAGTLGHYLHNIHEAGVGSNGRVVYAIAIAGISIFFALVLMPPLTYSFYAFPLDFAIFVCWMVAFGLLVNLVGSRGAIQLGLGPTRAGLGVDGIEYVQQNRLDILDVAAGEQLSHGPLSGGSSGFLVSDWKGSIVVVFDTRNGRRGLLPPGAPTE
ncbi:hypothetical protein V502_00327 [Pseudogymnoascus sp. VKM F-4520 (FW-2644)]|nr:hypothetical protein V502_00327 [Pseudogymnoascus sp. VKM F-4520 (FW-2644)]